MSITDDIINRIASGETQITERVGPRYVAKLMAADLRRWWETEKSPTGADSEAVTVEGITEVQGWSEATPKEQTVDWRVTLITVD